MPGMLKLFFKKGVYVYVPTYLNCLKNNLEAIKFDIVSVA